MHIGKRVQIEVAKSKIAAIKKLMGENTVKELEDIENGKILRHYVEEKLGSATMGKDTGNHEGRNT